MGSATARRKVRNIVKKVPTFRSLSRKNCPPGMIPRKSYTRKYSTAVRKHGFTVRRDGKTYKVYPKASNMLVNSKCIKNMGLPGKGPSSGKGFGPLRKGELSKYGYSFRRTESERKAALKAAVNSYGALGVYRKLNAVAKLTAHTVPKAAKAFSADRNWVRSHFGPLKKD